MIFGRDLVPNFCPHLHTLNGNNAAVVNELRTSIYKKLTVYVNS